MASASSSDTDTDDLIEYKPETSDNDSDNSQSDGLSNSAQPEEDEALRCKICNKSVDKMVDLIVHFLLEHEASGDAALYSVSKKEARAMVGARQKYICGLCGVECFDTVRETRRHMMEEHGFRDNDTRDSGADYSSEDIDQSSHSDVSIVASDNDSIDGVSSGMLSGMSSSTYYVSSPDSRTRRRSYSCSSSEQEKPVLLEKKLPEKLQNSPPILEPPKEELDEYFQSVTLKSLMQMFKSETRHKCSRKGCQYKFATTDVRERHLRCHADDTCAPSTSSGVRKRFAFKCYQCDQRFDSWKPCLLHLWHDHQIDLGMMRCTLCEKRFGYVVHVFNHLQTHRPKEMREIECRFCGKPFANTAQRSVHEGLHRRNGHQPTLTAANEQPIPTQPMESVQKPKTIVSSSKRQPKREKKPPRQSGRRCKLCMSMFSNAKILSKHVKTVHSKVKPFNCNICGYQSARKVTLAIHMRQHSGHKPLECKTCSLRMADPSALYYHERRHRQEKLYKCRICGKNTVQASALKQHLLSNHPQEYKRIKCRMCSFTSVNAQNLRRHKAEHEARLMKDNKRDLREKEARERAATGMHSTPAEVKHEPEISSDCFLPPESLDSVVHDAGGITIPATDIPVSSVAHSEDTQFPI